ncbi:Mog1 domain-containing protein [Phanerochaete sordida]|uniref:Mog1 domain-containing protein n=1 Tax=Phanerochaete sordida TaxID=48140 RepID=A0A9P3G250_9APHY|nr:Mog1 domain-containing protein [Phanerochaete sordida]
MSSTRELFGGAITVNLPTALLDASELRQVPDTQEVFLSPDSGVSIIFEVLERVSATDPVEAAKFHFDSLAHDNSATNKTVLDVNPTSQHQGDTPAPIILRGTQSVPKFNAVEPDEVQILLALYRIESKNVDFVMTMNVPTKTTDGGAATPTELAAATQVFNAAAPSLKIVDFGLLA